MAFQELHIFQMDLDLLLKQVHLAHLQRCYENGQLTKNKGRHTKGYENSMQTEDPSNVTNRSNQIIVIQSDTVNRYSSLIIYERSRMIFI